MTLNLERLNSITHPHILAKVRRWLEKMSFEGNVAAVVDAPLLFESGFDRECDKIILVKAPIDLRISRIVGRDKISEKKARERIASQIPDDILEIKSDFIIINDAGVDKIEKQVEEFIRTQLKTN